MRKIDLYWMSNREWWEYVDHIRTIKDSAPPEAKESIVIDTVDGEILEFYDKDIASIEIIY